MVVQRATAPQGTQTFHLGVSGHLRGPPDTSTRVSQRPICLWQSCCAHCLLNAGCFGDGFYRLQLYVDDPCVCIAGDEKQRSHIAATILLRATLGIRLAYRKASSGTDVTWIGCTLAMHKQNTPNAQVIVRAKQDIVEEIKATTMEHQHQNVVSKKDFLSYIDRNCRVH